MRWMLVFAIVAGCGAAVRGDGDGDDDDDDEDAGTEIDAPPPDGGGVVVERGWGCDSGGDLALAGLALAALRKRDRQA